MKRTANRKRCVKICQDLPQELLFKAPVFGGDQLCETWVTHGTVSAALEQINTNNSLLALDGSRREYSGNANTENKKTALGPCGFRNGHPQFWKYRSLFNYSRNSPQLRGKERDNASNNQGPCKVGCDIDCNEPLEAGLWQS